MEISNMRKYNQQKYKGRHSKNFYLKNKIWQNGDNQIWSNIHTYMVDRATTV